ncbi:peptidoglycan-binding protein [Spirulina sp. CCNP1310]|uniref:peptidoglycan-binding protein n=1 Tax=Spirulina sp. CCNP1310 TaxID=3110249 RepID=UPI002B20BC4D|nr:peptidoglycan-binding protein [Spirulina sp. CCNP1310]MEA5421322.1 peptidoglycan-binding protein [Spirulina sp. CCNP1310]
MDILAYTYGYAAHEAEVGITYDFSEINLWQSTPWRSLSHGLLLTSLSLGLIAGTVAIANPATAQTLRSGMNGEAVAEVQTLLRNQGFPIAYGANGAGRGRFGPQTEQAVRNFQKRAGLSVDGIVGPQTLSRLRGGGNGTGGPSPARPSSNARMLGPNSKGDQVAELQTLLRNKGYSISYGADGSGRGVYNDSTINAVRRFQQDAGISVDGIAGPQTFAALRGGTAPAPARAAAATAPSGSQGQYRINTQTRPLNVRTGPGEQYSVATTLAHGTVVNVIGQTNGWAQIAPGRYVTTRFIQKM